MKKINIIILFFFLTQNYIISQEVKCTDLIYLVKNKGAMKDYVGPLLPSDSEWLFKVTSYEYNNYTYVIAEIKRKDFKPNDEYIFCGIPQNNWNNFRNPWSDITKSYGEKFNQFIIDYVCNCK